jgi:hypothetical protein
MICSQGVYGYEQDIGMLVFASAQIPDQQIAESGSQEDDYENRKNIFMEMGFLDCSIHFFYSI